MKKLSHYILSHKKNSYSPAILAETGAVAVLFVVLVVFGASSLARFAIYSREGSAAAIYTKVLVDLANENRAEAGLLALATNPLLEASAKAKAEDMATKGYFAHYSPAGVSPWYWISNSGYAFAYAGENLAIDFSDSKDVDEAWMDSPLHRDNILSTHFTEIGIGIAEGEYQGKKTIFVVQMFASPALGAVNVAITTEPKVAVIPSGKGSDTDLIAVRNTEVRESGQAAVLGAVETDPTLAGVIITNPEQTMTATYIALAVLILIALGSIISKGIRRHNIRHIFYGTFILGIMVILLLIFKFYIAGSVVVL